MIRPSVVNLFSKSISICSVTTLGHTPGQPLIETNPERCCQSRQRPVGGECLPGTARGSTSTESWSLGDATRWEMETVSAGLAIGRTADLRCSAVRCPSRRYSLWICGDGRATPT